MPHYFFHIRDGGKIIPDEEGLELSDDGAAIFEAQASAVDMLADAKRESIDISHQAIEVTNSLGLVVALVEFRSLSNRL
jgi:hypothetical protein